LKKGIYHGLLLLLLQNRVEKGEREEIHSRISISFYFLQTPKKLMSNGGK
jgi:hypothetical protein